MSGITKRSPVLMSDEGFKFLEYEYSKEAEKRKLAGLTLCKYTTGKEFCEKKCALFSECDAYQYILREKFPEREGEIIEEIITVGGK